MAKSFVNPLDMMREAGIEITPEQEKAWREAQRENFSKAAKAILSGDENHTGKLIESKTANKWTKELFEFAENFRTDFVSEEIGKQGRGTATQTRSMLKVETPSGVLSVSITY